MISADDIAALVVVADRAAPFSDHLKRKFIDIHWVLDRDSDGTVRPSRILGPVSPHKSRSPDRKKLSGDQPDDAADGSLAAAPSSKPKRLSLVDLDLSKAAEDYPKRAPALITSPRSALIILRNGFGVADLIGVQKKAICNQALLDGASKGAVQLRLEADLRRRELRREMLMAEYAALTRNAPMDDVVEAMRDHYFAAVRDDKRNLVASRVTLDPLVPVPARDAALFDDECVDRLKDIRNRAADELTRIIDQKERQRLRTLRKEEQLLLQQQYLAGDAKQSNIHRDRILAARRAAAQAKATADAERSRRLIEAQKDKVEQRRVALLERRDIVDERAVNRRSLSRIATKSVIQAQVERREVVRQTERELIETRRDEVEAKAQFKSLLHQRNVEKREEELARRRRENEERLVLKREQLHQAALDLEAKREHQMVELVQEADRRQAEIIEARKMRKEARKERVVAKQERLTTTKAAREAQRKERLAELDREYEAKREMLDRAETERLRSIVVNNEKMALVRFERAEEQARAKSVSEFKYVGYVSANHHKSEWIDREFNKRRQLGLQMRQEREAIGRSKDEMLTEIDGYERAERRRLELQYR